MQIEAYFQQFRRLIDNCSILHSSNITYDKRGTHEGFIRGIFYFVDDSVLHLREFVDVETEIDRLMYVYHYMDAANSLIFRYDNTGHHKKLNLSTYPHHKHIGSDGSVIAANAPSLAEVLSEIEGIVRLPAL